ncbi:MAG TPA: hypothetical protein VMT19_11825 [Thermoanaerobaculaceae bacterium]|nr:hypothetical protein [Thermoanaerobaculaceae bacterium]
MLDALGRQSVRPASVHVFSDGPRDGHDRGRVEAVRRLVGSVTWAPVRLTARPGNVGAAVNIVRGLDDVFASHDRAIVVEDDVLPASRFVETLQLLLGRYHDEPSVFSVGAYPSLLAGALSDYPFDAVVSPRFSVWGWATWGDRWKAISPQLLDFRNPFASADEVPETAGADLRRAVTLIEARPGFYWDYPVALLCLHRHLVHVLTRGYLVANIGRSTGTHGGGTPADDEFCERHTAIQDTVPVRLPPPHLRADVCAAIHEYLDAAWAATAPTAKRASASGTRLGRFVGRLFGRGGR